MDYKKVIFPDTAGKNDILIAILSGINFDSFEEKENELIAYIEEELFDIGDLRSSLSILPSLKCLKFEIDELENKNWNAVWESSFKPVIIDDKCTIRASFHDKATTEYEIEIEPKMAFGTGHHATTHMMISFMLNLNFKDKTVLDFGSGTGILSVLAEKLKAKSIFANDVEDPAFENLAVNAKLNNCTKISNNLGGVEVVPADKYDIILANVNTKALSENLHLLKGKMHAETIIMLSGILIEQREIILKICKDLDFILLETKEQNKWTSLLYKSNFK